MISIRKEITNSHTLYLTKRILYRTRTEKGLEAYRVMKRLVYVAYRMCGRNIRFISYDTFLKLVLIWLSSQESIYEFMSLGDRLQQAKPKIFELDLHTVLKGTYGQIERQLLDKSEGTEKNP